MFLCCDQHIKIQHFARLENCGKGFTSALNFSKFLSTDNGLKLKLLRIPGISGRLCHWYGDLIGCKKCVALFTMISHCLIPLRVVESIHQSTWAELNKFSQAFEEQPLESLIMTNRSYLNEKVVFCLFTYAQTYVQVYTFLINMKDNIDCELHTLVL